MSHHPQARRFEPLPSAGMADAPSNAPEPHSALLALCVMARLHHLPADAATLAHQLAWPSNHQLDCDDLLLAARQLGLKARLSRSSADRLNLVATPALAVLREQGGSGGRREGGLAHCDGLRGLFQ